MLSPFVRSKPQKGSTVVEFALILPFLLLILFAIINFGVLLYNQSVITNAAREGARWASLHSTLTYGNSCTNSYSKTPVDPCQVAYSSASNILINFAQSNFEATANAANYNQGTPQTISMYYSYTGIGWFFGGLPSQRYTATSVMLHE